MPLVIDDLRGVDDAESLLATALAEEAQRTFDLEREFPIMVRLIRMTDDDHVLSVVMHHVASDGWSFQVFFADLGRALHGVHRAVARRRSPSFRSSTSTTPHGNARG